MSEIYYKGSPLFWSVDTLVSHGHQVVTDLARDAGTASSTMRYLLGRCMLAMDRLETYKDMGLSSSVHFATQRLRISERSAKTTLSVSKQLEDLPLLAQAVLHAEIEWSQIREVVSVATPDTEEMWKKLCIELNCKQIQILVAATPKGGVPGEIADKLPRKTSEYRCRFQPEVVVMIERGLQKMSKAVGKPLVFREAVERFFTEFLADKPYDEAAEKMLEEARKDFLAGRIQQEPLVVKAREVAAEFGLLQEVDGERPLSEAVTGEETRSQDALGVEESLEEQAAQVLEDLQQAIGESFSWEAFESGEQSSTELVHMGETSSTLDHFTSEITHVGTLNPNSSTPPVSGGRDNSATHPHFAEGHGSNTYPCSLDCPDSTTHFGSEDCHDATTHPHSADSHDSTTHNPRQDFSRERSERPTSKVTRLHTPFQSHPSPGQSGQRLPKNWEFHNAHSMDGSTDKASQFKPQAPVLLSELMAHLKFNPNSRFPTKAQRKALLRRDRYCCRTPGCTNHLFLEIHHIKRYSQGGKTLPEFLVTLCSRCHKNTEEGKLFIRRARGEESGQLIFTDQHGNNLEQLKRQERALWLDFWLGWKGTETDSHWARAMGFSESAA